MKLKYDVVVVGAGPAGSLTARHAAEGGASVLMIEKKPEIGAPLRCAEGVSKEGLKKVGIKGGQELDLGGRFRSEDSLARR